MARIIDRRWKRIPTDLRWKSGLGEVLCSDALVCLNSLRDNVADIVFLDPPFNLGKKYGSRTKRHDLLEEKDYSEYLLNVITRSVEILKPGGALYLYHIPKWASRLCVLMEATLTFRHWIAVSMKNGFARGDNLYPAHYALLYFTKGKPATFNRPKISPLICRHCKGYVRDYGGYESHIKKGINLSDIWDDLSPVRHKKFKHRVENELPLELMHRVVSISGSNGGLLVDPFAGSGTSALAAFHYRMQFIASDLLESNCQIMRKRLFTASISERSNSCLI